MTCVHFTCEESQESPQLPEVGTQGWLSPDVMVLTWGWLLHPCSRWEESRAWSMSRVHFEMGTLRMGKGGEHQLLEGNAQESNGDGGVRTARTTNLLFSQYLFLKTVLFLLTIFSLKVATDCKILSFRELMCGEMTFQLQLSDIFLLSVSQCPLVSLGHVINCIAEHILEQTANFKSLYFSLRFCIFCKYLFVCKGTSGSLGYPHGQELSFVQCLGLC